MIQGFLIAVIGILTLLTTAAHLAKELRSFYPRELPKINVTVLNFAREPKPAPMLKPRLVPEPIAPPDLPVAQSQDERVREAVLPESIAEKSIDIRGIALVRCAFRSQYYEISQQKENEERYSVGSGIVFSDKGFLATVRHVVDAGGELANDPTGRVWSRHRCDAALTDQEQTSIAAYGDFAGRLDPRFKEAEVIFMSGDEVYLNGFGLDLAILKIKNDPSVKSGQAYKAAPILRYIAAFGGAEPLLAIGYPGKVVLTPQTLERFDGQFIAATFYKESLCGEGFIPCGFRYVLSRRPADYQDRFGEKTEYGIITPKFRSGFSGAPVFFKGNFIGMVTHLNLEDEKVERVIALTSFDIFEAIRIYHPELLE